MARATQKECAALPLIDVAYLLRADKDRRAQREYIQVAEAEAKVFSEERLVKKDVRKRFASDPKRFRLTIGELTPEGFEFARGEYQRWLGNVDRWKGDRTTSKAEASLRKALAKFRARSA